MSFFEDYARRVVASLDLTRHAKRRVREEIVAHLEDEKQSCMLAGVDSGEAERLAVERFGDSQAIGEMVQASLVGWKRIRYVCIAAVVAAIVTYTTDNMGGPSHGLVSDVTNSLLLQHTVVGALRDGVCLAALLAFPFLVARYLKSGPFYMAIAGLLVVAADTGAAALFDIDSFRMALAHTLLPLLPGSYSDSFILFIYLCWAPALAVLLLAFLCRPTAKTARDSALLLALGALTALVWSYFCPGRVGQWWGLPRISYLPYSVIAMLTFPLFFVLLTDVLARALAERLERKGANEGILMAAA